MRNIKSIRMFEMNDDMLEDNIFQLNRILEEVEALMIEANDIVRMTAIEVGDDIIYERWKAYPYNNIMSMLSSGNRYETAFVNIIEELERAVNGEQEDF